LGEAACVLCDGSGFAGDVAGFGGVFARAPLVGALVGDAGEQVGLGGQVGGPVGGSAAGPVSVRVRAQASRSAISAVVTGRSFMAVSGGPGRG
jgi:hypothetical protein